MNKTKAEHGVNRLTLLKRLVFREKWKKNNHGTKKIYIKSKKLKRSKTRKKRLKDTHS